MIPRPVSYKRHRFPPEIIARAGAAIANAQTAAPPEAPATLNAIDFNFVGQAKWTPAAWRKRRARGPRSVITPI